MCRATNCVSDWPERNRRCPPRPPHPPTPNKPLLFFFLKHEFPSYTTHAPLPFSRSLTTCISPLSYPSLLFPPPSPLLPLFVHVFLFLWLSWNYRFPHDSLLHQPKPDRRKKSRMPSPNPWVRLTRWSNIPWRRGGLVSANDLLHDLKEGKKIQEANYSFPLFAFCFCEPFLRQTLKE